MKRFSEKELWAFVNRADTHEKIQIASDFLTKLDYLDIDVYDNMMNALAYKSRELYHQDEDMDDYDEYLDGWMQTEDEDERRIFRCRQYNL